MSFSSDYLLDRLRLKRRLRIWQAVGVVAVCAALLILGARVDIFGGEERVARLWVEGVIRDNVDRDELLAEIAEDKNVKALIVRINSPGGSVVGGEALYKHLRMVAEEKPVVAVMGEVAASAGYMTALAADHIVAREGTITGSIGVLMQSANVTGLMEKIGVKPVVIKSAPLKAVPSPVEPLTEEAKQVTQEVILDMYDMFLNMVVERRGLELEDARKLADGRIYTGRQALSHKLIDETGGESKAIQWLETEKKITKELPLDDLNAGPEDLWEEMESRISGTIFHKALFSEGLSLDGLLSVWQPNS